MFSAEPEDMFDDRLEEFSKAAQIAGLTVAGAWYGPW